MKKCLLMLIGILCGIFLTQILQFANAEKIIVKHPQAPNYRNSDGTEFLPNDVSYIKVNELETILFNKNYTDQPLEIRLARLERKMFGAAQSSNNYNSRLEKLSNASSVITGKPGSPEYWAARRALDKAANNTSQDSDGQNITKVKNKMSKLGSIFSGGQMTGYTPPIYDDPYNPYAYQNYGSPQSCPPYSGSNPGYIPNTNQGQQYANVPYLPQYSNSNRPQNNGRYMDIFSNGGGDEYYNKRQGKANSDMGNTGGGMGITIIGD